MAATDWCLPPADADDFKRRILSGDIDPLKLAEMSSKDRHAFFAERFGERMAGPMNSALESKLLLKNQQQGMISWAKRMMSNKGPAQRDMVSKIQGMKEMLNPQDEDHFLEELASAKLGTRITYEEAQKLANLSKNIDEARGKMESGGDRMEYGRAVVNMRNYVGELTNAAEKLTWQDFKSDPVGSTGKVANMVAGNAKSIKASFDNSAIFRQGWKTLLTHPDIWQRNARQSFVNLVKAYGSEEVMNELNADIISRPTYDLMKRANLAVGVNEEAFPATLPEKIPVLGKIYRSTEHAYTAFVRKTRADVFDAYIDIARKSGVDLNKDELLAIGKLTNSLTGRGNLGPLEPVANVVNNVFFSPRMVKASLDTLTMHATDKMSGFTRKQAAINLLKIIMGSAAILAIAKAIKRDSVEVDPRSSDFGKIRVGNTRFDVSGGMAAMATLISRISTMSSKSSTTGRVNDLHSGKFGAQTGGDVVSDFFANKLSPAASVARDVLRGQTFQGDKPTVLNEAQNLFVPLGVSNAQELYNDPRSANMLAAMIADALGIATNTYGPRPKHSKNGKF